jgi:hypothetical protein
MIPVSSPTMKEAMTMQINLLWLLVGLLPYTVQWQQGKDAHSVHIRALFWRLHIRSQKGQHSWELSLPLIEHWPQG